MLRNIRTPMWSLLSMRRNLLILCIHQKAWCVGFVPSTDLLRHASGAHKFYTRYVLHGMLRFTKQTRSVSQAGAAITALATGDKFKGRYCHTVNWQHCSVRLS